MENFNLPNLIVPVPVQYSTRACVRHGSVRPRRILKDTFVQRTQAVCAGVRGDFRRNASSFFCSRGSYGAYECH